MITDRLDRIVAIDAARGVALIGMMAIHVLPGLADDGTQAVSHTLAHGRAAALFALLAGVSLGLATRRVRAGEQTWSSAAAGVFARAVVIAIVGLTIGYLDSGVAVILVYYAVFFVVLIPLIGLRAPTLVTIAVLAMTVVPVVSHVQRSGMPAADRDNPTFTTVAERPLDLLGELLLSGYYPALPWLTYLCVGLAVSQLSLRSVRTGFALLATGVAVTAAAWGGSRLLLDVAGGREQLAAANGMAADSSQFEQLTFSSQYGVTPPTSWWWLAIDAPHTSTPFDLASTTGTALVVLGAALLVGRVASWALVPLAAAGSMTLTLYTAHVVALALAPLPTDELTSYVLQVCLALAVGMVWKSVVSRGPLEALAATASGLATRAAGGRSGRTERA